MSQANRRRRANNARRRAGLSIDQAALVRPERRRLARSMQDVPLLEEVRAEIAEYSAAGTLELLSRGPRPEASYLLGRLVREVVRGGGRGAAPCEADVERLLVRLANVADPAVIGSVGRDFSERAVTRMIAAQLPAQRQFLAELPRVVSVMADPDPTSLLGSPAWRQLMGLDPIELLGAVMMLASSLQEGPLNLEAYLAIDGPHRIDVWVRNAVKLLAADQAALEEVAIRRERRYQPDDYLYDLGPLAELPIFIRDDGRIAAIAADFVRVSASLPALHIRLVGADAAEGRRDRSTAVGRRLQQYAWAFARDVADGRWQVRDLDAEPAPGGKIADLAIWPSDRSFLVVVETKASLQAFDAQLGDPARREAAVTGVYQKSYNQIDATVASLGRNGFLADAPRDVPVFGLTVTMDLHLTTVVEGRTYFGVALGYRRPSGVSAIGCQPSRVVPLDGFEAFALLLSWASPRAVVDVLSGLFAVPAPSRAMSGIIGEQLGSSMPQEPAVPSVVAQSFDRLADVIDDPTVAGHIRSLMS